MDPNLAYTLKGQVDQTVNNPFFGAPYMPGTLATQPQVTVGSLLKPYPQYGDLTEQLWGGASDHYYSYQFKAERPTSSTPVAFTSN